MCFEDLSQNGIDLFKNFVYDKSRFHMGYIFIGKSGGKEVFITPYSQKRFEQRNLSYDEALQALNKRDITYPRDEAGRQKIRSKIGNHKNVFLVIQESNNAIIIITGGEA